MTKLQTFHYLSHTWVFFVLTIMTRGVIYNFLLFTKGNTNAFWSFLFYGDVFLWGKKYLNWYKL